MPVHAAGFFVMEKLHLISRTDGSKISVLVAHPEREPIAVLQLIHGMCGCKERFEPVMDFLASHGIICIASDLRGHGESASGLDDLGYIGADGYRTLVSDIRIVSEWGQKTFTGLPYFILGHSMGSLAVRVLLKDNPKGYSGAILCGSPSWNPLSRFGKWFMRLGILIGQGRKRPKIIQKLTSDKYNKPFASEGYQAWTCSDPEVRKSFMENPLCNFTFTIDGAYCLLNLMFRTYKRGKWKIYDPMMPIMFMAGSDDPCIISEEKFHKAAEAMHKGGYRNVTSILYPGMRHEVLNEIDKQDAWNDILDFILSSYTLKKLA